MASGQQHNTLLWRSVAILIVAMITLQTGAAISKRPILEIGAAGTTSLRILFASILLCAIYRPWREKLSLSVLKTIALYGVTLGGMNLSFYLSLGYIPLGVAVALEFIGPLSVAILGSRKRIDVVWIGLAAAGIYLLLPTETSQASSLGGADSRGYWQGICFALLAAMFWAFYILIGKRAGGTASVGTVASLGMVSAALVVLPFGLLLSGSSMLEVRVWPTMLAVALLSSAIPYTLEMIALKAMPSRLFGLLMSMEPAIASLAGLVILREHLTYLQCLAIALIMAATVGAVASTRTEKEISRDTP